MFILLIISLFMLNTLQKNVVERIGEHVQDIAKILSRDKEVIEAYLSEHPSQYLDDLADNIVDTTNVSFVVFNNMDSIRYSHINKNLIGKKFTGGDEKGALNGRSYYSRAVGISGPSIRGFAPIYSENEQIGFVAVGFFQPKFSQYFNEIYKIFITTLPIGFILIIILSYYLSINIKNSIFGLEPIEIATLLKEKETILDSMREGLIAINKKGKITMINDSAKNILNINGDVLDKPVEKIIKTTRLVDVVNSGKPEFDQKQLISGKEILTNRIPIIVNNKIIGAVATFRDSTEINELAEKLTGFQNIVSALRARTHEYINKLHTISGLIQLGKYENAINFINHEQKFEEENLGYILRRIKIFSISGFLLGKYSEAKENNIEFNVLKNSFLEKLPKHFNEHDAIVVLGNLIDNSFDALKNIEKDDKKVRLLVKQENKNLIIEIKDNGSGIKEKCKNKIFDKGFSTKKDGKGMGLNNVINIVNKAEGQIEVDCNKTETKFKIKIPY
ncbi:sensor histidine kinase [Halanaerobium sp. MA284_MarDTE_T2]|uniref:ATP-binding protein n=1 Tax=Halanaerobium sp. MA284_MarDTE_T2 TaxID=2183913 RepID=UPI00131443BC|nr:sensor histidine kinase [Halanaerobium sp. MA284_MarDTE_T2]